MANNFTTVVSKLVALPHTIEDDPAMNTQGSAAKVVSSLTDTASKCNLAVEPRSEESEFGLLTAEGDNPKAKFVKEIAAHQSLIVSRLEAACDEAFNTQARVFSVGGNHTRAVELAGYLRACQTQNREPIVVWIDAHLDSNTPDTSESGNVHGMVAALLFGKGDPALTKLFEGVKLPKPENVIFVGSNQEDAAELALLNDKRCEVFRKCELTVHGGWNDLNEYLEQRLNETPNAAIWIEVDLDVCHEKDCPGVVMPNEHGIAFEALHDQITLMANSMPVIGMGVTELCLANDVGEKTVKNAAALGLTLAGIEVPSYEANNRRRPEVTPHVETFTEVDLPTPPATAYGKFARQTKVYSAAVAGIVLTLGGLFAWRSGQREDSPQSGSDFATVAADTEALGRVTTDDMVKDFESKISSLEHEVLVLKNPNSWDRQYCYTGIFSKSPFAPIFATGIGSSFITDERTVRDYASLWAKDQSAHDLKCLLSVCFANELVTGKKPGDLLKGILSEDQVQIVNNEYRRQYFKLKAEEWNVREYLEKWKLIPL